MVQIKTLSDNGYQGCDECDDSCDKDKDKDKEELIKENYQQQDTS